ncbi:rhombosortase [Dermatophilus congolensis]|uniref:Rhombosortase n=1 Tax=Dermatophilus congolensis TaxID=1863 RepID=A0AA46BNS7_9MICO|nr:rhomboid family intramembrane serine protease [Dermatophilus congolensis]STD11160.1 rhombosortase [Dermatophilus congolensis]
MSRAVTTRPKRTPACLATRLLQLCLLVGLMWACEIVDQVAAADLDQFGIQPRSLSHWYGILLSPFLHAGFAHLITNTGILLTLGILVALITSEFFAVTASIIVLGGAGVWLFGPAGTVHVGASGLIYGYAAFLIVFGFSARRLAPTIVGIIVACIYGGLAWGLLPSQMGVSWQAHLSGAIAGVYVARHLGHRLRSNKKHPKRFF